MFWRRRNFPEESYTPTISPYGEVVWSHNITGSSIEQCPYTAELQRFLVPHSKAVPPLQSTDYKPLYHELEELDGFDQYFLQANLEERIEFLEHYIDEPHTRAYKIPAKYSTSDYFDCVFACPFDFEQGLNFADEKRPLWLQICESQSTVLS